MSEKNMTNRLKMRKSLWVALVLIPAIAMAAPKLKEEEKARGIVKKVVDRDDGRSSYSLIRLMSCSFKMTDGKYRCASSPRMKVFEGVSKDVGANGKDSISLSILIEPADEKGVAFLQKDYDDESKDSDQWIYLPALKRMKRIVSEGENAPKTGTMFGSEFAYEDMEKFHISDYMYSYEGEEEVDGRTCYIVIAYPTASRAPKTSYSKVKMWVDKTTYLPIKTENYDRTGNLKKTTYSKKIEKQSGVWISRQMIIVNHSNSRMSMIDMQKNVLNIEVDESVFETRALQDADFLESKMRPIRAKAN